MSIMRLWTLAGGMLALLTAPLVGELETYEIDSVHSGISFKVRHFFTQVPGSFSDFSGTITVDRENMENSSVEATIQVASVDTNNSRRDDHLMQDDFFDQKKHPLITFKSTDWKQVGENQFHVTGDLTIMGTSKPVTLLVDLLGFGEARGKTISGWDVRTTLNRSEWGVDGGKPVVGEDVEVEINIQARKV